MIHVSGGIEQENTRFHHATQNGTQLKIYELFVSRILHLILSDHVGLWVMKLWIRGNYYIALSLSRLQVSPKARALAPCSHLNFSIGISACCVSKRMTMSCPSSGLGHWNRFSTSFLSCGYYDSFLYQPNNWILVKLLVLVRRALQLLPLWPFLFSPIKSLGSREAHCFSCPLFSGLQLSPLHLIAFNTTAYLALTLNPLRVIPNWLTMPPPFRHIFKL